MALVEYYGTGRRKTSTARVHLRQGSGAITVNHRPLDVYFGNEVLKMIIKQPLSLTETVERILAQSTALPNESEAPAPNQPEHAMVS